MMFGVVSGGDGGVAQQLRAPLNPEPAGGPSASGFTPLSSLREAPRSFWQRCGRHLSNMDLSLPLSPFDSRSLM